MPHYFFTSYARLDNNKFSKLGPVIEELRERVRAKLGARNVDTIGFFDTRDIKTGADWEKFLGDAVGTARVIVCMCSPTYFNSEYSAKEFEIFRLRRENAGTAIEDAKVIVPVVWEKGAIPASMAKYQYHDNRLPDAYIKNGLGALKRVKGQRDNLTKTLDVLAEIVAEAKYKPALPIYPPPVRFDALPRAFHNPSPEQYGIATLVLHENGTQWTPFNNGDSIAAIIEKATSALKVPWRELSVDANFLQHLVDAASQRETIVVVTDLHAARMAPWNIYLNQIDSSTLSNFAVLVGAQGMQSSVASAVAPINAGTPILVAPSPTVEDSTLRELFRNPSASKLYTFFPLEDVETFQKKLVETITKVRLALVAGDPASKVDDPNLRENAKAAGIFVDKQPTISGPGGGGS